MPLQQNVRPICVGSYIGGENILERKRRGNMAVRRLKGLYLKSEGKYLEDYPSRYVEQTQALFEWRQSAPKQDIELHKRAEKFSGLFREVSAG